MRKSKKTMWKRIMAVSMVVILACTTFELSVFAEDSQSVVSSTGGFSITGGTSGTDYTYENNVLTILSGTALTITNADPSTTITDSIVVNAGVSANITLDNVTIAPASASPISVTSGATANITLVGDNTLTGGKAGENDSGYIAYAGIYVPEGATLVIDGTGSLTASGGSNDLGVFMGHRYYSAAGIGGNSDRNEINKCNEIHVGKITINGGTVIATSGKSEYDWYDSYRASAIGGGRFCESFDGSLDDVKGECEGVTINGGSVKADSIDELEGECSLVTITLYGAKDGTAVDTGTDFPENFSLKGVKTIEDKLYFYLPSDTAPTSVTCGDTTYVGTIVGGVGTFCNEELLITNPSIDLSKGSVTFSKMEDLLTYTVDSETKLYSGTATVTDGTGTGNVIKIENGTHNITLDNVSVAPTSDSPISITSGATANITLVGDNTLTGGSISYNAYAGIYVPEGATLVIDGTGSLTAIGGSGTSFSDYSAEHDCAAGIGGNSNYGQRDAGNIMINGGAVTAIGGSIENQKASSIGGGYQWCSTMVEPSETWYGTCEAVTINGGSVKSDGIEGTLKNSKGEEVYLLNSKGEEVYLLKISNPDNSTIKIDHETYTPNVHSSADKNIYVYLTGTDHMVKVGDKETRYEFLSNQFRVGLTANMFTYKAPESLDYDGMEKSATVTKNDDVTGSIGEIAVKYYDKDGNLIKDEEGNTIQPTNAGTYTVAVDVVGSDDYSAVTGITDEDWTFTIKPAKTNIVTVTAERNHETEKTIYSTTPVSEIVLNGTAKDKSGNIIQGTFRLAETVTGLKAGTKEYDYVFEPYDTNYQMVEGTVSITVVQNKVKSIAVTTPPTKTVYTYGETFLLDGLVVTATYENGTTEIVTDKVILSNEILAVSQTEVTLSYTCSEGSTVTTKVNGITVNKATPTIQVTVSNHEKTFGDADFTLDAIDTSTETEVQYEVTTGQDVVTVSKEGTVSILKAGDAIITVSLPESTNYSAATSVTITITVKKATEPKNKPGSRISASNLCTKVSDVTLPDGWEWAENEKETELTVDTPVNVTARYTGANAESYETIEVQITITRSNCTHTEGKVICDATVVATDKAPTCTESGLGHTVCTKSGCGAVVRTGITVPSLGHNYKSEVTEPATTSKTGIRTYTCTREGCGDSYTETIPKKSSSSSSSSSSTTNPPSTETPSTEAPSTEEPSTEESSTEEPTTEDSGSEKPSTSEDSTIEWKTDEKGTFYEKEDGTRAIGWMELEDDNWYYFDEEGYRENGWIKDNGNWYYLSENGSMQTDWVKVNGEWYYLNENGTMKTGWQKDVETWYYLGVNGAMQTGWIKDKGIWYFLSESGAMKTGWLKDGTKWYYLNVNGSMETGWLKDGKTWYYLNESGAMQTGWLQLGANWFYLNANGSMAEDTYIGKWYVDKDGYYIPARTK